MNRHFKSLELDKILELLANETSNDDAHKQVLKIEPTWGLFEVNELLTQTDDAYMLIGRFGAPSFSGLKNVANALRRAQAGGCLTTIELLRIAQSLRIIRGIKEWRNKSASVETSLDNHFESLSTNKFLEEKINTCIIGEEELSDNASSTLYDIRRKIRVAQSKAREVLDKIVHSSTYQKYLQDAIITQRDGRYVVPVKAECRGNVAGLVHDTSSSGSTVFIEPMGVVQANNDIRVLESKEKAEIERILYELSATCGTHADEIIESYNFAVDISVIFAKAQLAYKMKAVKPKMNDKGIIDLKQARHPLIPDKNVVPTDITLGKDFDTLVITGPNTGGKTVSLKTIGLLTLMAMCGLMVPCDENSELSTFRRVLVDIGDEQSIEQSLSTFSAHMTNIIGILKLANRSTLALIDELGAGTDPVEGAALAVAILEKLRSKGAKIASTTHYAELKEYALKTEKVENGCCEFDVKTLRPTYKLLIGVPGKSNAFAISKRLGMEDDIVDRAKQLVSAESRQFEDVVETLEERRQSLDELLKQTKSELHKAKLDRELAQKELERTKRDSQREIEKAKHEASLLLSKTKAQAYALIDELEKAKKSNNMSAEDRAKIKRNMRELEDTADPIAKGQSNSYKLPRELKVGDKVLIFDIDKKAEVLEKPDKGQVLVQAGIIKTRVALSNLRLLNDEKVTVQKRPERKVTKSVSSRAQTEIDLRGQTAIEAIIAVDQAIDTAILTNTHTLTVIHGKGTGVLRAEIHRHLKTHKAVKHFRLGTFGEGEAGVTIVELK
ncbi:MAG: endonuclease MutS2 [Ruminococcaceae bacterium]|nr:endonuclease MutS2 [Oscillospiraceae bacterium]